MDLMTRTLARLVTEQTIPAFGPYSASVVSLDSALDRIVSSTAAISQVADGRGDPHSVATLISDRLGVGFGSTTVTLFVSRLRMQYADERRNLHTWPLAEVSPALLMSCPLFQPCAVRSRVLTVGCPDAHERVPS